jgi:8-oxo-dGTP pyrophosphatase MutT (NUDIX family)
VREYWEETGVTTEAKDWQFLALQHGRDSMGDDFDLHAFFTVAPHAFTDVTSATDEEIHHVGIDRFVFTENFVSSVPWLVFLAKDLNMRNRQLRVEAYYSCEARNDNQTSS